MSIQTELTRIINAKAAIKTAIEGKGVTVPDGTMLDGMAALIEAIQAGGTIKLFSGTITPSKDIVNITIEHNMGRVPKIIFIAAPKYVANYVAMCALILPDSFSVKCYSAAYKSKTTSPPSTSLLHLSQGTDISFQVSIGSEKATFYSGESFAKFHAGDTYTWYML